jgi:hypothetical protein
MFVGETVKVEGSLLARAINTVDEAGAARLTGNGAHSPGATVTFAGRIMSAAVLTVTFAVASVRLGALARITDVPGATPVTDTVTVVSFSGMLTVGEATVATPVLLELTLNVKPPAGAGPDKVSVRFCVAVPLMARFCGVKLMVAVTWTSLLAVVYRADEALMAAVPRFMPVT